MEQTLKRAFRIALISFALILFGCEENDSGRDIHIQSSEITKSERWFTSYKKNNSFHPVFENIDYHWESAVVVQLENNSTAIAIPMRDNPENPNYQGKKMLYLYPKEGGYDAVVHEIFPRSATFSDLENEKENFQELNSFSGYILTWDLKEGFVKGAEFENGFAVKNIPFADIISEDPKVKDYNLTRKAPPDWQMDLDSVIVTGGSGSGGCGGCSTGIRFTPSLGGGSIGGGTGGYFNGGTGGGGNGISAPTPVKIIDALIGKAKCINDLLNKNGDSFVQNLLANFQGKSEFDILIISKDVVTGKDSQGVEREINGRTLPPEGNSITIEISTSKSNSNASLEVARTILHEYIHADIFRKLETKLGTSAERLDFKTTFDAYGNQHNAIANLYLNSMKEALKAFHQKALVDDYNKYTQYYGEAPNDAFYEALAWGGLRENNVKAWTDVPADKKATIESLSNGATMLSKMTPCTN